MQIDRYETNTGHGSNKMYTRSIEEKDSNKLHLILYFSSFLCHGLFSCNIGPLIPYLSQKFNKDQTDFSFLFIARTIGSVIGIATYRLLQSKYRNLKEHKLLAAFSFVSALSMLIFVNWQSNIGEWISMAVIGFGTFGLNTVTNVCMAFISVKKPKWLLFGHAIFGIGAFISPFIIMSVQINMFYVNFGYFFVLTVLCLIIQSPSHHQFGNSTQHSSDNQATLQTSGDEQTLLKQGSVKLQILLSLSFFLIAGVQSSFLGWISSYAVLSQVCDKKKATLCVSIFWIMSSVSRILNTVVKTKSSFKLKFFLGCIMFSGITCLGLHYSGNPVLVTMAASIMFGFSCSGVFPAYFAVPHEYGLKFEKKKLTNMLSFTVPSMVTVSITGELMKLGLAFLFYSLICMALLQILTSYLIFKTIKNETKQVKDTKVDEVEEYLVQ